MKKRLLELDIAKGIGIILVVYGHTLRGLVSAGRIPQESQLIFTDYAVYTFHMPLFFVLSGFFFGQTLKSKNIEYYGIIIKIAFPYFLWSILTGLLQVALSRSSATNNSMEIGRLTAITWDPILHFWFLYSLFVCHLLWITARNRLNPGITTSIGLIIFLSLNMLGARQVLQDISYGFLYFSMGVWISRGDLLERLPTSWRAVALFGVTGLTVTVGCYALNIPDRLSLAATATNLLATLTLCRAIKEKASAWRPTKVLVLLGQCSMGIYVLHVIVVAAARFLATRVLGIQSEAALLVILVAIGLAIPAIVQLVAVYLRIQNLVGLPTSAKLFTTSPRSNLKPSEARSP